MIAALILLLSSQFILLLIYLLLKRHLNVFYVAQTHVLREQEFSDFSISLYNVFVVLDDRIEGLGGEFLYFYSRPVSYF